MADPFRDLYDRMAHRKGERDATGPYEGGNGRIDRAVDLILNEDFPSSGVLLDVGGANGNLGYALRERFRYRWVLDISADSCTAARHKGNESICGNVDADGILMADNSVDLITALDLIEHILDPEKFARECYRVLKPGGKVLINTPNIQYWRHLESLVCRGVFPHTSGDKEVYHGGHTAFYNVHDMRTIFGAAGFVGTQMHTRGLSADPPPPIWPSLMTRQSGPVQPSIQLSYADLIFSGMKP